MNAISGYQIPFTEIPIQSPDTYPKRIFSNTESFHMQLEITRMLQIGAISKCTYVEGQYVSDIFLVPKKDGGFRFILNLKKLNKFVYSEHFKMEDIRTASKLLTKDSFMVNIDLKEAYFLLPIHKSHRKYLRFIFNENLYEFSCLPFGLSSAPYIFTKILNPVITELRSKGFLSVRYLDDILCIGRSYNQCVENAKQTIELLTKLGFVINYKKSTLTPNKSCKFLGFVLNSENMTLGLPQNKRSDILERVKSISKLKTISIRDFASFLGKLIAACPAIPYSWVYTKSFERAKYLALLDSGDNYDTTMHIPNSFCDDLRWWKNNILNSNNPIRREKYSMEIFTDASKTGWGAACNNERTGGHWSAEEQVNHINYLELLAVFFGLRSFASDIKDCAILLRVDNTTAISYVNRMGGVQYPHFNDISKKIWQWCEVRRIFIFASYIKSSQNTVADFESRQLNTDTEWELSDNVFSEIIRRYGQPDIDLFATRINAKCDKYISWRRDPYAFNIDAFTVDWHPFFFYAFPPFSLILKILNKLINDGATGILVVPYWPSQPWYPLFKSLCTTKIMIIPPSKFLLSSVFRKIHPLHHHLSLAASVVSGNRSLIKPYRTPL